MRNFIEFYGSAHLNNRNIASYETRDGVMLVAENIITGEILGELAFDDTESADDWFANLQGESNAQRLDIALEIIR